MKTYRIIRWQWTDQKTGKVFFPGDTAVIDPSGSNQHWLIGESEGSVELIEETLEKPHREWKGNRSKTHKKLYEMAERQMKMKGDKEVGS